MEEKLNDIINNLEVIALKTRDEKLWAEIDKLKQLLNN